MADNSGFLQHIRNNGDPGRTYKLPCGKTVFGSSLQADIRFKTRNTELEDTLCIIDVNKDGMATLVNKSQATPVFVNGVEIENVKVLCHKDTIKLAGKQFVYNNENVDLKNVEKMQKLMKSLITRRHSTTVDLRCKKTPNFISKIPVKGKTLQAATSSGTNSGFIVNITPDKKPDTCNIMEKAKTTSKVMVLKALGSPKKSGRKRLSLGGKRQEGTLVSARNLQITDSEFAEERFKNSLETPKSNKTTPVVKKSVAVSSDEEKELNEDSEEEFFEEAYKKAFSTDETPKNNKNLSSFAEEYPTVGDGDEDELPEEFSKVVTSKNYEASPKLDSFSTKNSTPTNEEDFTKWLDSAEQSLKSITGEESVLEEDFPTRTPRKSTKNTKVDSSVIENLIGEDLMESAIEDFPTRTPRKSTRNIKVDSSVVENFIGEDLIESAIKDFPSRTPRKSTRNIKVDSSVIENLIGEDLIRFDSDTDFNPALKGVDSAADAELLEKTPRKSSLMVQTSKTRKSSPQGVFSFKNPLPTIALEEATSDEGSIETSFEVESSSNESSIEDLPKNIVTPKTGSKKSSGISCVVPETLMNDKLTPETGCSNKKYTLDGSFEEPNVDADFLENSARKSYLVTQTPNNKTYRSSSKKSTPVTVEKESNSDKDSYLEAQTPNHEFTTQTRSSSRKSIPVNVEEQSSTSDKDLYLEAKTPNNKTTPQTRSSGKKLAPVTVEEESTTDEDLYLEAQTPNNKTTTQTRSSSKKSTPVNMEEESTSEEDSYLMAQTPNNKTSTQTCSSSKKSTPATEKEESTTDEEFTALLKNLSNNLPKSPFVNEAEKATPTGSSNKTSSPNTSFEEPVIDEDFTEDLAETGSSPKAVQTPKNKSFSTRKSASRHESVTGNNVTEEKTPRRSILAVKTPIKHVSTTKLRSSLRKSVNIRENSVESPKNSRLSLKTPIKQQTPKNASTTKKLRSATRRSDFIDDSFNDSAAEDKQSIAKTSDSSEDNIGERLNTSSGSEENFNTPENNTSIIIVDSSDVKSKSRRSKKIHLESEEAEVTTPKSAIKGRRSKSLPYYPETEEITPVTPTSKVKATDKGFKTPLNTPMVFENIRKSVLRSRSSKLAIDLKDDSPTTKGTKRPRDSEGLRNVNKKPKLDEDENETTVSASENESYSFFDSFLSDDYEDVIPMEDDTLPEHFKSLSDKPLINNPQTRSSNGSSSKRLSRTTITSDVGETMSDNQPESDIGQSISSDFMSESDEVFQAETDSSAEIIPESSTSTSSNSTEEVLKKLPQKSPKNDLSDVKGLKRLLRTPKVQKSPKNDLENIPKFKKLITTPKVVKSPKNDLSDVAGVKKLLQTPKIQKSPKNDLRNVPNLRNLVSPKMNNEPLNDLSDVEGVDCLFNVSGVGVLQNDGSDQENDDLFSKLFQKKPFKTYRGKSLSPNEKQAKHDNRKTLGDLPVTSPQLEQWLAEQRNLRENVVQNALHVRLEDVMENTDLKLKEARELSVEDVENVSPIRQGKRKQKVVLVNDIKADYEKKNKLTLNLVDFPAKSTRSRGKKAAEQTPVVLVEESPKKAVKKGRKAAKTLEVTLGDNSESENSVILKSTVEVKELPKKILKRGRKAAKTPEVALGDNSESENSVILKSIEAVEESPKKTFKRGRKAAKTLEVALGDNSESENSVIVVEQTIVKGKKPVRRGRPVRKIVDDVETDHSTFKETARKGKQPQNTAEETKDGDHDKSAVIKPVSKARKTAKIIKDEESVTVQPSPKKRVLRGRKPAEKQNEELFEVEASTLKKPVGRGKKPAKFMDEEDIDASKVEVSSPKTVTRTTRAAKKAVVKGDSEPVAPIGGKKTVKKTEEVAEELKESPKKTRGKRKATVDIKSPVKPAKVTKSKAKQLKAQLEKTENSECEESSESPVKSLRSKRGNFKKYDSTEWATETGSASKNKKRVQFDTEKSAEKPKTLKAKQVVEDNEPVQRPKRNCRK